MGKISVEKQQNTIYRDLNDVIAQLEKEQKFGTYNNIDDFNYPWIHMIDNFRCQLMGFRFHGTAWEDISPHFRWLCFKDFGNTKRIIYLVGSEAYQLPRSSKWSEPEELSHHFSDCLSDLQAGEWEGAGWNLVQEVQHYTGKIGIESKIETVFEVLHRSVPIAWDKTSTCRVTFGTPLYVAEA